MTKLNEPRQGYEEGTNVRCQLLNDDKPANYHFNATMSEDCPSSHFECRRDCRALVRAPGAITFHTHNGYATHHIHHKTIP